MAKPVWRMFRIDDCTWMFCETSCATMAEARDPSERVSKGQSKRWGPREPGEHRVSETMLSSQDFVKDELWSVKAR